MTLMKRTDWPSLINNTWLSDFFDKDRFFDSDWMKNQTVPSVNVTESEKNFELEMAAPGLTKKDFKITAEKGMLTISSEKKEEKEEREKDCTRKEFNYTSFSRSFTLPENTNEDDIRATYENGILKLAIAKKVQAQSKVHKAIEVN
jgi:HSP20 family protein